MLNKIIAISILSLSFFITAQSPVSAQAGQKPVVTTTITPTPSPEDNVIMRTLEKNERSKESMSERKAAMDAKREEIKEKRETAMEEFKEKREDFKEKMKGMKDQKKQQSIENIDKKISNLNTQHTDRLQIAIEKLTDILDRVQIKAETAKTDGSDTKTVDAAITEASTLIETATEALVTQAGKEYVIDITDEAKVRESVKKTFDQFKSDMSALHMKVKAAHEAVRKAAMELGKIKKPSSTMEATVGAEESVNKTFKQ